MYGFNGGNGSFRPMFGNGSMQGGMGYGAPPQPDGGREVNPGDINLLRMMYGGGMPQPGAGQVVNPGGIDMMRLKFGMPFGYGGREVDPAFRTDRGQPLWERGGNPMPMPRPMPMPAPSWTPGPNYHGDTFYGNPMPRQMPMPGYGGDANTRSGPRVFAGYGGMPAPDGGPVRNPDFSYGGGMPSPDGGPAQNPGIPQREFANNNPFYNAKGNLRMKYRPEGQLAGYLENSIRSRGGDPSQYGPEDFVMDPNWRNRVY